MIAREPAWEEHRCLTLATPNTNLHVFSVEAVEPLRHIAFRDWLRAHGDDRQSYEDVKRAAGDFRAARAVADDDDDEGMHLAAPDYNAAKAGVVYDIYERIFAADARHDHAPQPRVGIRRSPST